MENNNNINFMQVGEHFFGDIDQIIESLKHKEIKRKDIIKQLETTKKYGYRLKSNNDSIGFAGHCMQKLLSKQDTRSEFPEISAEDSTRISKILKEFEIITPKEINVKLPNPLTMTTLTIDVPKDLPKSDYFKKNKKNNNIE